MRAILSTALVLLLAAPLAATAQVPDAKQSKAVLVTGASTGIGRNITERLAASGYFVYAGARKESDLAELGKIKNVQAVRLDVTNTQDIEAAVATITKAGRGLYGLVNNAGVATVGTATGTTPTEFDLVMSVNLYGPYRITRAFAPLIVAQKGRITNIGSLSGTVAPVDLAAYAMSKHAIEAFTDSLAGEMAPQGVQVSVVEPGNYDSEIGRNAARRTGETTRFTDRSRFQEPDEVAAVVAQSLFEPNPRRRYLVVPEQREAELTIKKQIQQLAQLNEGHAYTYSRGELVKMLDEALAQARPKTH